MNFPVVRNRNGPSTGDSVDKDIRTGEKNPQLKEISELFPGAKQTCEGLNLDGVGSIGFLTTKVIKFSQTIGLLLSGEPDGDSSG